MLLADDGASAEILFTGCNLYLGAKIQCVALKAE